MKAPGRAGLVSLTALVCFALLTTAVVLRGGTPLPADASLLSWAVGHRPATAVTSARDVTSTGTDALPYLLAALAGVVAGRTTRHRLLAAAASVLCLGAGQALRQAVLHLMARSRPPAPDRVAHASGWSFPSGHATTAALTAALLITAVMLRSPRGRCVIVGVIGCWGVAVGLTRVYLGVHWFSDVVGGWLFALAWFTACLWAAARWLPPAAVPLRVKDPDRRCERVRPTGP
ncbi:phosphoesterase [Streptomyces eurocidicus]|uniref:Phosphoesterase n=1 Tax=Streptomyces eurocidicus TaxID=66423 RepID=A0A2N8NTX6_STREU|nr:phosphatase PAP2 family protein [Streptomyces eurocidicus]MBB5119308.1 undecaprenyl-diphosphatase [Streptomyces eurocidicus]MBF6053110.1 phosphatase PAP2 family protein [Streptomyces eurocidicus]PNE32217.1 phosphoesterase [Streptomyces eurocidicus]